MVDGNKLGDAGFRYLGVPYSTMDCQAFVEQCLRDCGMKMDLAGSNAWFREVMRNGRIMTPEECTAELGTVPRGAFLFILEHDGGEPEKYKPDGLGNASHIGLVTMPRGEGAIHSSASRGCVAESEFKGKTIRNGGWNRVGLWDKVSYDYGSGGGGGGGEEPMPDPEPTPEPGQEYARVWSENGKPVNTRKGPGTLYPLSKAGRLPVGSVVEILKRKGQWDSILCTDQNGAEWYCWMKDEFLKPIEPDPEPMPDPEPEPGSYTVEIPGLDLTQAKALRGAYPNATIREEG